MLEHLEHFCFFIISMKFANKLGGLFLLLITMTGCGSRNSSTEETEKYAAGLNDNQARLIISIGGKPFYPDESVFSGQVIMSGNVLNVTLTDQFDSRTIINLAADKWYARQPVSEHIENYSESGTSVKMGKLVDREKLIGEGYMLTNGDITAVTFERDRMVFEIEGKAAKFSDFQKPDQYLPFHGLIVYKKPAISYGDVNEQTIFESTHSNR
jgi:hypothetical protein